jgi:hypothetical protein
MRILFLLALLSLSSLTVQAAKLYGRISDAQGQPLAFASVYIQGTSTGTTSNMEGDYALELDPGSYQIVYSYVGYRKKTVRIEITAGGLRNDVTLEPESFELLEITVRADAEDPAYPVIRKAIEKRSYYRRLVNSYQCRSYIKGTIQLTEAPKLFMGQEIGDLDGMLDSTGKGILYLSESESMYYVQEPNKSKEIMISSKVSGNDNGFSFNNASDMNFNLYDNTVEYNRPIVSPIANNAFTYYRYKLLGTTYDEDGRLINKIQVLPKRQEDPVFGGVIYIVEDLWNIQYADLYVLGKSVNQPILDTLFIRQTHVPIEDPDVWRIFSQVYSVQGKILGFKFQGSFTGIFSEYQLNPGFEKGFFDREVLRIEAEAREKGLMYFDSIRPIPLTMEEQLDYQKKDSLQVLRSSKPYLDSLDKVNNRFTFNSLLLGYKFSNSYERWSVSLVSPLNTISYNTVQGFNGNARLQYRKAFDKDDNRWIQAESGLSYGWDEQRFRADGAFIWQLNRTRNARLTLEGGTRMVQYNEAEPISPLLNSFYSFTLRQNFAKFYDKTFVSANWRSELFNGVFFTGTTQWAQRSPLVNNSERSWLYQETREFTSNNPLDPLSDEPAFETHEALQFDVGLRIRFKQEYIQLPDRKINLRSKWPTLWLRYRAGVPFGQPDNALRSQVDFQRVSAELRQNEINLGLYGRSEFRVEAGAFLREEQLYFMDFQHFNGNQTLFGNTSRYLNSYMLLPYYTESTTKPYFTAHYQHFFKGFLLERIPGVRKLGLASIVGARVLQVAEEDPYWELSFGLDQIGFGFFRFFRLDGAVSFSGGEYQNWGLILSSTLPIGQ